MKFGGKGEIKHCKVECPCDVFENSIRDVGVEFACHWFGHDNDSDFTKETILALCERSGIIVSIDDIK